MDEFELNPIGEEADGGEQESEDLQDETKDEKGDEGSGTGEGEGNDPAEDAARQEAEKSRKFNTAMKAARQRAERETTERLTAAHNKRIADMRIPNPDKPGEYFSSMEDLDAYSKSLRRVNAEERAKREKRTVNEILEEDANRDYLSRKRREEEEAKKKEPGKSFIAEDIKNFRERFPDVDIAKLDANAAFHRFAGSRYGKEPLADLYEAYVEIVGEAKRSAGTAAKEKKERGTGGSSGKGGSALTASQRAALQRWNENNPDMKMSEKEFLERS